MIKKVKKYLEKKMDCALSYDNSCVWNMLETNITKIFLGDNRLFSIFNFENEFDNGYLINTEKIVMVCKINNIYHYTYNKLYVSW